jgi:glutamate-ammonia-ligase adenylyltransferase
MRGKLLDLLKFSLYLQREFNRNESVFDNADIGRCYAVGELVDSIAVEVASCSGLDELNKLLRVIRNREMVRIAVRDLGGVSEVVETIGDLSDLARGLISASLDWHYIRACEKFGVPMGEISNEPQKMLVIGMGKLGGRELNFSSDIDLIFAYPERGYAVSEKGRETSNNQFFIRLGQALNRSLGEVTGDGFVYRVDMRLRPFGNTGSLAVSFTELENYYANHGRAWERYALVKARVLAGDEQEGEALFDILRPFVYRKYIDYSSLDSLRKLKQMIQAEVVKKEMFDNIKLGRGGIREIEFIVQVFQLIHGGRDKNLQSRSLLKTLQVCTDKNYLTQQESADLKTAYLFLRKAENRLQEWNDQQTHDLPSSSEQQHFLAESMGFKGYDAFIEQLDKHRQFVQQQFDLTFAEETEEDDFISEEFLEKNDFLENNEIMRLIEQFKLTSVYTRATSSSIERFEKVLPKVLAEISQYNNQIETLKRILSLFESVLQRSVYMVLLIENKTAIVNLVLLCSMSQWLTEQLVKSPILLDQLLDGSILFDPLEEKQLGLEAENIRLKNQQDDEAFMNQLREWKNAQVFKVAAADLTGHLPIMKVSDYLTWIAESVLNAAAEYAWQTMLFKHGQPADVDEKRRPLLVLGYGKMGGSELGYGSDLDIVFLSTGIDSQLQTAGVDGKRQIYNGLFMTRLVQKIISLMSTIMPTGTLYEIDSRLRPNGATGLIIGDFNSFVQYQQNKAWTWEHQALVRARAVVFDKQGFEAFEKFKQNFLQQPRELTKLKTEVVEMRQKMADALDKSTDALFDLKQGRGGIVDIEFMVQFWVLAHAYTYKELTAYSDNFRLLETLKNVVLDSKISQQQIAMLQTIYCEYRNLYHRLALQNVDAKVSYKMIDENRKTVISLWQKVM